MSRTFPEARADLPDHSPSIHGLVPIDSINAVTGRPTTVYNFHVEELHCYAVGAAGILVHNICHHIVSQYKNLKRGFSQPWTIKSQEIMQKAGVGMQSATNKVNLVTHWGPRPA